MAYNKRVWRNNETPLNADNMNNIENGISEALDKASSAKSNSDQNTADIANNSSDIKDLKESSSKANALIDDKDLGSDSTINNEGDSKPSLVSGTANLVGAKAYSFSSYSVDTSTKQTTVTLSNIDSDINSSLVNQEVTMIVSDNTDAFGKVTSVDTTNKQIVIDAARIDTSLDTILTEAGIAKTVVGTVTTYSGFTDDNEYVDNIIFFPFLTDSDGNWKAIGTRNIGYYCFAAGGKNAALSTASSVVGWQNNAEGRFAFVSGRLNKGGYASLVGGRGNRAMGNCASAMGTNNRANGKFSFAGGNDSIASGDSSIALGDHARATATGAFASGYETGASGKYSSSEGNKTTASGDNAHSEGLNTTASGASSHSEGQGTTASGDRAHVEGANSKATKEASHAEGRSTEANGDQSHAEGLYTVASGGRAHAEGWSTEATKDGSHAGGMGTKATAIGQTAIGIANAQDDDALFIVGNGTYTISGNKVNVTEAKNAFTVRKNGDVLAGGQKLLTSVPIASETVSGTVKVGTGLSISDGVLSSDASAQQQSNWLQNDVTAVDFIQNRTHWEEFTPEATYNIDYVSGSSIQISGYGEYFAGSVPEELKDLTFYEGDIVYCSNYTTISGSQPIRGDLSECVVGDVIPSSTLFNTFGFGVYKDDTAKAPAYLYSVDKTTGKIMAILRLSAVAWSQTQLKVPSKNTYHKLDNSYIDIEGIKQAVIQSFYPIGSVYSTTTSDNPRTLLGFGDWELLTTSETAYNSFKRIS